MKRDPEKAAAWRRRSALKAQERARARAQELRPPVDRVREVMSRANPPRPDEGREKKLKRRKPSNPGNNPTPPLAPKAKCVNCLRSAVHNHHVLERQLLRRERLDAGDPRAVVPVCFLCHGDQTSRMEKLALSVLPDEAFEFAFEGLGPAAYDALRRRYVGEDPRLDALLDSSSRVAPSRTRT